MFQNTNMNNKLVALPEIAGKFIQNILNFNEKTKYEKQKPIIRKYSCE